MDGTHCTYKAEILYTNGEESKPQIMIQTTKKQTNKQNNATKSYKNLSIIPRIKYLIVQNIQILWIKYIDQILVETNKNKITSELLDTDKAVLRGNVMSDLTLKISNRYPNDALQGCRETETSQAKWSQRQEKQ